MTASVEALAAPPTMSKIDELADRVERLVLRHEELKRTNALLEQQLAAVTHERDSLRSRLAAARARIDALLERLPADLDNYGSKDGVR
jgi:uncharacterized protein (TIGR02449 family)